MRRRRARLQGRCLNSPRKGQRIREVSLFDLNVPKLAAHLRIVVLLPHRAVKASQRAEHLVAELEVDESYGAGGHFVRLDEAADAELGHEHLGSCDSVDVRSKREQEGVLASLRVPDSELLTICEQFSVILDVVGALKTQVEAELLLSLKELVDVVKGTRLLPSEPRTIVVPGRETLRKAEHFYLII